MSTNEKAIQDGLQTLIQAMSQFANADVVINDWTVLDGSTLSAPYILITNADDFNSQQNVSSPETRWNIKIILVERFLDWKTSLNSFRQDRQALIDQLNSDDNRSANGITAFTIDVLRSNGPIIGGYLTEEPERGETPIFLLQEMIAECEEY